MIVALVAAVTSSVSSQIQTALPEAGNVITTDGPPRGVTVTLGVAPVETQYSARYRFWFDSCGVTTTAD